MGLVRRTLDQPRPLRERRAAERGFYALLRALNDPRADARYWAARDLAHFHGATATLLAQLRREQDLGVREAIGTALVLTASAEAARGFLSLLREPDAALRNLAIEALQLMPDHAASHIDGLLVDRDPDIRIFAVNIVAAIRHPRTREWLRRVLADDAHVNVCAAAIDALADTGGPEDVDVVTSAGSRFAGEPYISFAVGEAVARLAA